MLLVHFIILKEITGEMKKRLKDKKNKVTSTGFVMLIFVFLMGCAGIGKMSPLQMDEMLLRAGFQLHKADTPKKLDFLKTLPQKELVHKTCKEKIFYFYVDGSSCQCMFVGDEQAYLRFKRLVKQEQMDERISTTSRQILDDNEDFPFDPQNPFNIENHLP
jgi:hypothetical protein